MVGQRCVWNNAPNIFMYKSLQDRIFKILSVTLTHVYIRNVRTGFSRNVHIRHFEKEYEVFARNPQSEEETK